MQQSGYHYRDLYDAASGELLFKKWLGSDRPLKLFFDVEHKKFIGRFKGGAARYTLDGKRDGQMAGKTALAFSENRKQAFYAKEKNVWVAEADWEDFRLKNDRQLTSINSFYENYFAENIVFLTTKTLIVRNMNTLLRVNLENGDVRPVRIPLNDIAGRRSPDGRWLAGLDSGKFYCYDVDTDEAKTIPLGRGFMNNFQWLSNDRCIALAGGKTVVNFDRVANSLTPLVELPLPCTAMAEPSPDGRFIFCIGRGTGVLVDLEKKTAEPVNGGSGVCWVRKDIFAFSREVPDSNLRGTWIERVGEGERRVSPEPYLVTKAGGQLLVLQAPGLAIYATRQGLSKMKQDGTGVTELLKLPGPAEQVLGIEEWKKN